MPRVLDFNSSIPFAAATAISIDIGILAFIDMFPKCRARRNFFFERASFVAVDIAWGFGGEVNGNVEGGSDFFIAFGYLIGGKPSS